MAATTKIEFSPGEIVIHIKTGCHIAVTGPARWVIAEENHTGCDDLNGKRYWAYPVVTQRGLRCFCQSHAMKRIEP